MELEAQVRRMADLAWAAGVLDARGSLVAYERKQSPGVYIPRIRVRTSPGNTAGLVQLRTILGGNVGQHNAVGRMRHEWQLSGAQAVRRALDDLIPYLRLQVRTAQLLRELCIDIEYRSSRDFDRRFLSPSQVQRRKSLARALGANVIHKL